EFNGMYASHVRNRDAAIVESVEEFLAVARAGNLAGQISHLNVRHDTNAPPYGWERAVELMMAARESGMDIQADATPFRYGLGMMTGILPAWLIGDGYAGAAEALAEPTLRNRLRGECDRYWRFIHKGQWERVRLQNSGQFPELAGKTFPEIAAIRGQDVWDSYFDILQAAGPQMGDLVLVGELFTEEHLAQTITHPLFALGVDAYTSIDHGPLSEATVSPLPYRGHIEYLTHHVRDRGILPLEEAIRKMSGMPAERFGLKQRGLIEPDYFADLVVFDYAALASDSTFERPAVYPRGVRLVTVNGTIVVADETHTGSRPGRVLRRAG
ncbi:MAG: amidohydrolase family protein, partial [Mycobacterium sp.]|nr:amidohydrolase family protein [Mycobacterium sp.]